MALLVSLAFFVVQAIAAAPAVVEIEEPAFDAKPLDPEDVHMVAEFAVGNHVCSDWQIWTAKEGEPSVRDQLVWDAKCATETEKVHIHFGDGDFVGPYEGRLALFPDSAYVLRVRARDGSEDEAEWSDWAERLFTTREPGPVGSETETWKAREGYVVETFAEDLMLPTDIAMVTEPGPHGSDAFMYVTELYGRVKVITRNGTVKDYTKGILPESTHPNGLLNFQPTGNFPGSGEMGVTGIAVEPDTGDVLVSFVYEDGESSEEPKPHYPKVVRLIGDDDGLEAVGMETVLDMKGALQGASHQVSNLTISPDGHLFVHNGDGGLGKDEAPQVDSYLGKILRLELDGDPVESNPYYDGAPFTARDYVYAKGFRNPFGGAWRLSDATYWEVENGPQVDRLAKIVKGDDYLWPGDMEMKHRAAYSWNPSVAPTGIEFVEPGRFGGSGLPEVSQGHAFVAESGPTWASGPQDLGKGISEFDLSGDGGLSRGPIQLVDYVGTGKATVLGLAAGPDGLYFTDLYKDKEYETPIDRGANVLRVRCSGDCPLADEGAQSAPAPPAADRKRPVVRRFRVRRKAFAVRGAQYRSHRRHTHRSRHRAGASAAPRYGTAFVYSLSERSTTWIRIRRLRTRGPRDTIRASGRPGPNHRKFAGWLRGRPLPPGRYRATIHARDRAGNVSRPRHTVFRIARPR